jgi:hypothetical protein
MQESTTSIIPIIKNEYEMIGMVFCPYLGEMVRFNRKGIQHVSFKSDGTLRAPKDRAIRFSVLYLAPKVISRSYTIQNKEIRHRTKSISFYEFIAIIECKRVKVIIKQDGNGSKYFYSIIPFWSKKKINDLE